MDGTDERIVDLIQTRFPIVERPYLHIAETIGITETEVLDRIGALKEQRIIRRMGGLMEPRKIGYVSALVAAKVQSESIEPVVEKINSYLGVTHNYGREGEFNVWFTLIAKDQATHSKILDTIGTQEGVESIHCLPATRIFKLKVNFKAKAKDDDDAE